MVRLSESRSGFDKMTKHVSFNSQIECAHILVDDLQTSCQTKKPILKQPCSSKPPAGQKNLQEHQYSSNCPRDDGFQAVVQRTPSTAPVFKRQLDRTIDPLRPFSQSGSLSESRPFKLQYRVSVPVSNHVNISTSLFRSAHRPPPVMTQGFPPSPRDNNKSPVAQRPTPPISQSCAATNHHLPSLCSPSAQTGTTQTNLPLTSPTAPGPAPTSWTQPAPLLHRPSSPRPSVPPSPGRNDSRIRQLRLAAPVSATTPAAPASPTRSALPSARDSEQPPVDAISTLSAPVSPPNFLPTGPSPVLRHLAAAAASRAPKPAAVTPPAPDPSIRHATAATTSAAVPSTPSFRTLCGPWPGPPLAPAPPAAARFLPSRPAAAAAATWRPSAMRV